MTKDFPTGKTRYLRLVRLCPVLLALLIAGPALSDPLIDIPTARKLPYGTYKFEFAESLYGGATQLAWLDVGIGKSFEATVREEEIDGAQIKPTPT